MGVSKPARTFQDLLVWQKAHRFVLDVYTLTATFPKQETKQSLASDAPGSCFHSRQHR
jgi:hypothetical protein